MVLLINMAHVCLSFAGDNVPPRVNLLLSAFRPYYLIYNARSLRDVVKGVMRSVPRIMMLVSVIAFTVCCFGLVGYELFWDINESNFNPFEDSMPSLMLILTTVRCVIFDDTVDLTGKLDHDRPTFLM